MTGNPILATDSYKASHWLQYPPGTERVFAYIESRGCDPPHAGAPPFDRLVWFGLQMLLDTFRRVTADDIAEARDFFRAHGEPFNESGWHHLVHARGGEWPVVIRSAPEGTVLPLHVPLLTIENTDTEMFWVPSYMETALLRAVWYPTTVATISWHAKRVILRWLQMTHPEPMAQVPFKLHDFGARGVSSGESARIGGAAHLVNFLGSDTVEGVVAARAHYADPAAMPAFSIPASEHSTICAWGREEEEAAYANMIEQFARPGAIFACVSDSYDIWHAVAELWCGRLLSRVKESGATLVIRPDSGDPAAVVLRVLETIAARLPAGEIGQSGKGYRLLPPYLRVIQGDGVNLASIEAVLQAIVSAGWCASNVAFGMGGKLLQGCNRDTLRFAMKTSWVQVRGESRPVCKAPCGDTGKASKAGRLALVRDEAAEGGYRTVSNEGVITGSVLREVYNHGHRPVRETLSEVRARADEGLIRYGC